MVRALTHYLLLVVVVRPGREVVLVPECYEKKKKAQNEKKKFRGKSEMKAYPRGCCRSDTRSSTAVADAIGAKPGRVTVHI